MKKHYNYNSNEMYKQQFKKQSESEVPAVYASMLLAMLDAEMSVEDIKYLFGKSQKIWEQHTGDIIYMLIKCYNETGIQVMTPKQYDWAVKKGLIEEES